MGRRNIFIVLVLLVVLGFVIWVIIAQKNGSYFGGTNGRNENSQIKTRENISGPVSIPNQGDKTVENVAVPVVQSPAGGTKEVRGFQVNISGDKFSPDTVIVKQKDLVSIVFNAEDKNYDFTQPDYGVSALLPKGIQTPIKFVATASGKFTFYCSSCGGPAKGPIGYLVVSP